MSKLTTSVADHFGVGDKHEAAESMVATWMYGHDRVTSSGLSGVSRGLRDIESFFPWERGRPARNGIFFGGVRGLGKMPAIPGKALSCLNLPADRVGWPSRLLFLSKLSFTILMKPGNFAAYNVRCAVELKASGEVLCFRGNQSPRRNSMPSMPSNTRS